MAIPHQIDIANQLLKLLNNAPNGTMPCSEIYSVLAKAFTGITVEELQVPYRNSRSKWANSVQFARLFCVQNKLILPRTAGAGHGFWTISEAGRNIVNSEIAITNGNVEVKTKLPVRRSNVRIDEDVVKVLKIRSSEVGIKLDDLACKILRKELGMKS